MITDINSEDRLVQQTFAEHLHDKLGWDSVYAWNEETFGPSGTLGRSSEREAILVRDLRAALVKLNRLSARIGSGTGRRKDYPCGLFPVPFAA